MMSLYVMPSSCSLFFIREARAAEEKSAYLVAQLHALREDKRQVYVCNYIRSTNCFIHGVHPDMGLAYN